MHPALWPEILYPEYDVLFRILIFRATTQSFSDLLSSYDLFQGSFKNFHIPSFFDSNLNHHFPPTPRQQLAYYASVRRWQPFILILHTNLPNVKLPSMKFYESSNVANKGAIINPDNWQLNKPVITFVCVLITLRWIRLPQFPPLLPTIFSS